MSAVAPEPQPTAAAGTGDALGRTPYIAEVEGRRAGFVTRGCAFAIDFLIVLAGYPLMLWGAGVLRGLVEFSAPSYPDLPGWLDAILSTLWTFLYFSVGWAVFGRTVGQAVFGLRVVGRRKRRVLFPLAVLRTWLMFLTLFIIGPVWLLFSRSRLAIHDRATHTQVVYQQLPRRPLVTLGLGPKKGERSARPT